MAQSPEPNEKLQRAIAAHQAGNLSEAEALYREIIAQPVPPSDALHNLALLLLEKDALTAVELFRNALETEPDRQKYWLSYIEALIITDAIEAAQEALDTAISCGLERAQSERLHAMVKARIAKEAPEIREVNQLVALFASGMTRDAEIAAKAFTTKYPDYAMGWKALGAALAQQGKWEDALPALNKAIQLMPGDAESLFNMGLVCQQLKNWPSAESAYLQALIIKADYAEAYNNLGLLYKDIGQTSKAINAFEQAISIKPNFSQAHNNLGVSLHHLQQYRHAVNCFNQAITLHPRYIEAHNNLGAALQALGELAEAESVLRRSIAINPLEARSYNNLGNLLQESGRLDEAEAILKKALGINPGLADVHNNLGNVYQARKCFSPAFQHYQNAAALKPDDPISLNNMGTAAQSMGNFHQAMTCYQQALKYDPGYLSAYSNLLFCLNFLSDYPPKDSYQLAVKYGESVATNASRYRHWQCAQNPRRLRVGIVSGDLITHPVGHFLESILTELNQAQLELFAYVTHIQEDTLTKRIRPRFSKWNSLVGLRDAVAAKLIHNDGIHVLLDLSGHTAYNRLGVFACKPAPVQASWLGYFATTGIREMDYLIADPVTLPVAEEVFFTEHIWRLPETRLCFTPPETLVAVSPLPAVKNGYITFSCFGNLNKMNDEVVYTWAQILHQIPTSRLMLKAPQLQEITAQTHTRQRFEKYGIKPDRLILEGPSPRNEYLLKYQQVDIGLDTFPFTGGTTSAESLWMGVPFVTMAGERFVSRQGVGLLENSGLHAWVAKDHESYIQMAIHHAANINELATLRANLRTQVLNSPIFDAKRFATHLEQALWGMWNTTLQTR